MYIETERFLKYVFPEGAIVELRLEMADGMRSSRYQDMSKMATDAIDMLSVTTATYYGLNPLSPSATRIGNGLNRLNTSRYKRSRLVIQDVAHRNLYLIDVDPVRPSGVCSTDAEKAEAFAVADQVQAYLTTRGWPNPIRVDSGNGVHLYYRGNGCNAESKAWPPALKYLAHSFDTLDAAVDVSVGNAARISRLPGSWNRKGENTPDRPHRRVRVLSYPDKWTPVEGHEIYKLAREGGYDQTVPQSASATPKGIVTDEESILALIDEYPDMITLAGKPYKRGDRTIFPLRECPFAGRAHRGGPGKSVIMLREDGVACYSCFSDDCAEHTFGKLLALLRKTTGRPSKVFPLETAQVTDADYIRWGMTPPSFEEWEAAKEAALMSSSAWKHDKATWDAMHSPAFDECPLSTDPNEWGLSESLVASYFDQQVECELRWHEGEDKERLRRQYEVVFEEENYRAMGEFLGKKWLFAISRERHLVSYDQLARLMAE